MKQLKKFIALLKTVSPEFRRRLILMVAILTIFNAGVWIYTLIVSRTYPVLLGLTTLSYGLGLRHAVDADHIAAIDNTTRKLMRDGKKPLAVGFFFSLGHSTIVILLSLLVAVSAEFVKVNLPVLKNYGTLIGTTVSSFFLLMIGIINLIVLIDIFKVWRNVSNGKQKYNETSLDEQLERRGFLNRILRPFLQTVSSSWNMYFVGFLFGLGFDTASEVGLLSISAATRTSGIPIINVLLLPVAFTAGMAAIDTLDGVLMLGAYGWATIKPIRKLYYNLNITFISVVIALFIGSIEGMKVLFLQLKLTGGFFDTINNLDFGNLGYIIITTFIASWILSIMIYKLKRYDRLDK